MAKRRRNNGLLLVLSGIFCGNLKATSCSADNYQCNILQIISNLMFFFFLLTLFYIGKEILSHTSKIKIDYLHR